MINYKSLEQLDTNNEIIINVNKNICSICLEYLNIVDNIVKLECNHEYCIICLDKWISYNISNIPGNNTFPCPNCMKTYILTDNNIQYRRETDNKIFYCFLFFIFISFSCIVVIFV
jgi:hypothetical protein